MELQHRAEKKHHGAIVFGRRLNPIFHVFEGGSRLNQPINLLARAILRLSMGDGKRLSEPGDRLGVDPIVLGNPSGRLGEMTDPLGSTMTTSIPAVRRMSAQLRS